MKCESALLTMYKVQNVNAKLNICVETTAENEPTFVFGKGKMSPFSN